MTPQFIVAELSKNWLPGGLDTPFISQQFELVIETNRQRGYRLHSFQMHSTVVPVVEEFWTDSYRHGINETIIAVFEREERVT